MVSVISGRLAFLAGQTALDANGQIAGSGVVEQFERALGNLLTALRAAGGQPADLVSVTIYLVDLDDFVQSEILERFDRQNLNTLKEFADAVPTTENLCTAAYEILQRGFRHAHLEKVRIEETMLNSFEYAGGK